MLFEIDIEKIDVFFVGRCENRKCSECDRRQFLISGGDRGTDDINVKRTSA